MDTAYLIGVDFGGTSSKATLLSSRGEVVATAAAEYPTYYPRDGWAEQDPDNAYRALVSNVRALLAQSGVDPRLVRAIALDGATHTSVLLGEDDRPVRPAIYWTDRRSVKENAWLLENRRDLIVKLAYNAPSPVWTLPQVMWVRENEPDVFKRVRRILFMKDYVRYRLNHDFATDSIEAMGSMFLDVAQNAWSDELCALAGIKKEQLPRIAAPSDTLLPLTDAARRDTGLTGDTRVVAGATDTAMEIFAAGAVSRGDATVKLATAGRICPVTDRPFVDPQLFCYRHIVPGLWYPGTGTKSCAASYRWYRDAFGAHEAALEKETGFDAYAQMDMDAGKIPAGCDGLFFHPYLQGELTPYLDSALKGSFVGVTSGHTKTHFNRAVLEGVGYSLKASFNVIRGLGMRMDAARIIGGGSVSPLWRQIVADMLGLEMKKMARDDSSLGSAMLAGIASGVFSGYDEAVALCCKVELSVHPDEKRHALYEKNFRVYEQIHDALAPVYHGLSQK